MGNIDKVGSALKRSLTIWVAAISLLGFAPAVIYAQRAKPPAAGKAPAPWKFHLQEARIEDIHRAIKSRADHLRESRASLPQPNPLLRRHVRRARESQ